MDTVSLRYGKLVYWEKMEEGTYVHTVVGREGERERGRGRERGFTILRRSHVWWSHRTEADGRVCLMLDSISSLVM